MFIEAENVELGDMVYYGNSYCLVSEKINKDKDHIHLTLKNRDQFMVVYTPKKKEKIMVKLSMPCLAF